MLPAVRCRALTSQSNCWDPAGATAAAVGGVGRLDACQQAHGG